MRSATVVQNVLRSDKWFEVQCVCTICTKLTKLCEQIKIDRIKNKLIADHDRK